MMDDRYIELAVRIVTAAVGNQTGSSPLGKPEDVVTLLRKVADEIYTLRYEEDRPAPKR
jgi:hypothetical protein